MSSGGLPAARAFGWYRTGYVAPGPAAGGSAEVSRTGRGCGRQRCRAGPGTAGPAV